MKILSNTPFFRWPVPALTKAHRITKTLNAAFGLWFDSHNVKKHYILKSLYVCKPYIYLCSDSFRIYNRLFTYLRKISLTTTIEHFLPPCLQAQLYYQKNISKLHRGMAESISILVDRHQLHLFEELLTRSWDQL